jgi:hypothetical protein
MSSDQHAIPYDHFAGFEGRQVPRYLITFDKSGLLTSPKSADHLISELAAGRGRDVLLYSHGWNNDFPTAVARYDEFLGALSRLAEADPQTLPQDFDPVFVGIVWPSTALTILGENAPDIAAETATTAELAAVLASDDGAAAALAAKPGKLDQAEATELASLLVAGIDDDPDEEVVAIEPGDLIAAATAVQQAAAPAAAQPGSFDDFGGPAAAPTAEAQAAGLLGYLDPRWLVRVATVLSMKSRAGIVGRGVAGLVDRILQLDAPRLILTGHSYGAKVVMSALALTTAKRVAHGAALLQPAVSRLCFAADMGDGRPGGFRANLSRVQLPILTTYSHRDLPLYRLFHLVARRKEDLGEVQVAAESRFAALGGYGPEGCMPGEVVIEHFALPPGHYTWPGPPARIVAFDGTDAISGHGDVGNDRVLSAVLGLLR